jgi:hypothetical protein
MTTYEQIHTLWITMWTLVAFCFALLIAVGAMVYAIRQLKHRIACLERITRPANVQIRSTGGGGGGNVRRWPTGPDRPGVQVFEQDGGGHVRKVWPPEPPANT